MCNHPCLVCHHRYLVVRNTHAYILTKTHNRSRAHTRVHTNTYTHTHTYAHTLTHTHTHTSPLSLAVGAQRHLGVLSIWGGYD